MQHARTLDRPRTWDSPSDSAPPSAGVETKQENPSLEIKVGKMIFYLTVALGLWFFYVQWNLMPLLGGRSTEREDTMHPFPILGLAFFVTWFTRPWDHDGGIHSGLEIPNGLQGNQLVQLLGQSWLILDTG